MALSVTECWIDA